MLVEIIVENVLFLCDSVQKNVATMHAILRRCLELETRSTLETSFEIKVDQKQRVLLLLACYFHFLSPAINEVLQLEIRSPPIGALDASEGIHPPICPPGTTWMQSLRDYGSWRKLSSSGARNMRLAPIRCNHPPTEEPTSSPSRTSCAIPGSMAGCSLRCQPDLRESDQDSFSVYLR